MTQPQPHSDLTGMLGAVLVDTYRLDEVIGEGGMGAVFRGHHLHLGRDFAIKVLHPDYSHDPELVKRFDREAQSASRLDHPNCLRVLGFGTTDDGVKYIVMELLDGVEFQHLVDGPMAPRRAAELILQVVCGLEHAHSQGVVHRDLKPQNILATRDADGREVLKLVDFGIAKILHGEGAHEPMTRAGMCFGTPHYMSPEQALGQPIDARADLYAIGVLLYTLVAGRLPFTSDDLIALVRMQVSSDPPPLPDSVPRELAAIILRLLAKPRDDRFPDASALRGALEHFRDARTSAISSSDATLYDLSPGASASVTNTATPLPDVLRPRTIGFLEGIIDTEVLRRGPWLRLAVAGGVLLTSLVALWWLARALAD